MAKGRSGVWWPGLRTLIEAGGCAGMPDVELLRRFADGGGEAAESAFAALVDRHGAMVLRACRAMLRDEHDAEDAFQATFLVLALKARTIAAGDSIAPWLYRTACHVASRSRAGAGRRRRHERNRASMAHRLVIDPYEASREVGAIVHEEVARLPAWCRAPVVLCHLEGRTCEEAARALGLPTGTVKSRLARARARLRTRLAGRGVAPAVAAAALATGAVGAAVPSRLAAATARSAVALVRGPSTPSASRAVALVLEIRRTHLMIKSLSIASGLAAAALVGLGLSRAASDADPPAQLPSGEAPVPAAAARPPGLVAPRLLSATAGRGEALLFDTNARGERIAVDANARPSRVVYKETIRPLRWAVVVGTVDFRATRAAVPGPPPAVKALNSGGRMGGLPGPPIAPWWPGKRLDLERQERLAGGGWSDWAAVDADANLKILDHLTEVEDERVQPEARPEAFVDPLPFLKSGEWRGVDVEAFVDPRRQNARVRGLPPRRDGPVLPLGPAPQVAVADEVMIRSIDFTARPGATYRYRARVVVDGPAPKHEEMVGPWSGPTGAVAIPKE